jgi:hypothetical protein
VIVDTDIKVTEDGYRVFDWIAECSDCNSVKGDTTFINSVTVSGNLILDGYVFGEEFTFDQSNVVSFQYNGPSDHVDNLVIHNANYSDSDEWFDESDVISALYESDEFTVFGITFNPDAQIDGYTNFGENMMVSGWISADLSSYSLDLTFDTFVPVDEETDEYIKFSELDGDFTTYQKQTFNILYESNGNWKINVNGVTADLGRGAKISLPATDVPEPSTLAIIGLGLLGLVRSRLKKS